MSPSPSAKAMSSAWMSSASMEGSAPRATMGPRVSQSYCSALVNLGRPEAS